MSDEVAYLFEAPLPAGSTRLQLPPANIRFAYTAGRAMEFWPTINGNNATFFEDDIRPLYEHGASADLTFKGKLVNLMHEVGVGSKKLIVGSIYDEAYIPGVGIDTINRLDRRQLAAYEVPAEEMAAQGEYSKQSIEMAPDKTRSRYIVMKNPNSKRIEDQQVFSADEAAALGIRRTTVVDPLGVYRYEDKYDVVEAIVPQVVCGIAMLSRPADKGAIVFDVAAAQEDPFEGLSGYDDVEPMSMADGEPAGLADDGFAVVCRVNEGTEIAADGASDSKKRQFPLYKTPDDHTAEKPHKGLVKAAMDALRNPKHGLSKDVHAVAVQRIKKAHNELQKDGDTMAVTAEEKAALTDPLANEIAALKQKIADETKKASDEKAALEENINLKEKAAADALKAKDDEIAELKKQIADREATEIASKRLGELKGMKGFEVKADEEAALVEELKSESEDAFKYRKVLAENALLKKGIKPDENAGKTDDEIAALRALNGGGEKPTNALAALLA